MRQHLPQPDTATWDDSPWITAVGGTLRQRQRADRRRQVGPDRSWPATEGAGFSSVYARPAYQNGVAHITGSPMRSVPDITMDSQTGRRKSAPLLAGVLALATQLNGDRNVGPINPALYGSARPGRREAGIADVDPGQRLGSRQRPDRGTGLHRGQGFDVATGWGTINGNFVPSLVAATRPTTRRPRHARRLAELTALETQHPV